MRKKFFDERLSENMDLTLAETFKSVKNCQHQKLITYGVIEEFASLKCRKKY